MRILSRVFRGILFAAALVFAGVSPLFAGDVASDPAACTEAGFHWDFANQKCCFSYWIDPEGKGDICVTDFTQYCPDDAGYIDVQGAIQCCPAGTTPNTKTHKCDCDNGGFLDTLTGECRLFYIKISDICDFWNKQYGRGYFFNYLLTGLGKSDLSAYRSSRTCDDVINATNDGSIVWDGESCKCSCADPALTFNPAAADNCVEEGKDCEDICIDLSFGDEAGCPAGQRYYLVEDKWQCCFFYDPDSGTCIDTTQEWLDYVKNTLGFESGGGYVNAEGLPVECPKEDKEAVGVNTETGLCTCLEGGWFDTVTGSCFSRITLYAQHGYQSNVNYWPMWYHDIYKTNTSHGWIEETTAHGFFDKNRLMAFDTNGDYVYTTLPVMTPASTPYVSLDITSGSWPGVRVRPYIRLTLNGNGTNASPSSPSQQLINFPLGTSYDTITQTPTRTGYNFTGWYTAAANNAGTQVDFTQLPTNASDATYYAHWTARTYTVNLDKNSNSAANGTTSVTATYASAMPTPITLPSRSDGYSFVGYYDTSNASGGTKYYNADGTSARTWNKAQDATLYARWEQDSVSITLNKNGGTGTCGGQSGTTNGTLSCPGGTCSLPNWDSNDCNITNISDDRKVFVGWATTSNASSGTTGSVTASNGTTYYAIWKLPTCVMVTNASTYTANPVVLSAQNNLARCRVQCAVGYGGNLQYNCDDGNYTGTVVSYNSPDINAGCYPLDAHEVDYNKNGGNGTNYMDGMSCDYNNPQSCTIRSIDYLNFTKPSNSTSFAYWRCRAGMYMTDNGATYTNTTEHPDCGIFDPGVPSTSTLNNALLASCAYYNGSSGGHVPFTMFACWNYNISYDYDGGTPAVNTSAEPDAYNNCDGATIGGTAANDKPTKAGKVFAGWCDSDGVSNCETTRTISSGSTGAKSFKASWATNTYTITLNDNPENNYGVSGGSGYIYTIQNGGAYLYNDYTGSMTTSANPVNIPSSTSYHAFLGYYTAASGGDKIINENGFVTADGLVWLKARSSNTTIYAHWNQYCYVLPLDNTTYCGGGGTPRMYYTTNSSYATIFSDATCSNNITNSGIPQAPTTKEHSQYQNYSFWWTGSVGGPFWVEVTDDQSLNFNNTADDSAAANTHPWYARCACDVGYQGYGTYTSNACAEGITITLDKNGGSGGTDYVYTRKGNSTTGGVFTDSGRTTAMGTNGTNPITAPTRTNYSFLGYYDDDNDGVQMISGGTPVILGNGLNRGRAYGATDVGKTWYAHWQGNQYNVTYACGDGATGTPPSSTTARYGSGFTPSATPGGCTKTGYELSGWTVSNTNPAETKTPGTEFTWEYTENKTLTAVWTQSNYILTLTDNHESNNTRSLFEIYGVRWASNNQGTPGSSSITTVPMPVRSGYTFRGYYTTDQSDVDSNVSSTTGFRMKTNLAAIHGCTGTNCNTTLTQNTEWFAAWAEDCDMTGNGTCTLTIGDSGQVTYSASCDDANGYTLSGNGTAKPVCTANTYTVTLDANGGSGGTATVTATFGTAMPAATMPTRTNWDFAGYYDTNAASGGNQYYTSDGSSARSWDKTEATILYARWTQNSITCDPGEFYDASEADCAECPAGSYCPGGTFSGDTDDGINTCPTAYTSDAGQDAQTDCYITCGPGKYKSSTTATSCADVGANYWGAGGKAYYRSTLGRHKCGKITGVDGIQKQLQTTGSGVGANEAGDCGLALHIGTDILRLRSSKKTTPSLNFNYSGNNGADLFLNLSTNASPMTSTQNFKMNYGGTLYYGCDDTTCVEDE